MKGCGWKKRKKAFSAREKERERDGQRRGRTTEPPPSFFPLSPRGPLRSVDTLLASSAPRSKLSKEFLPVLIDYFKKSSCPSLKLLHSGKSTQNTSDSVNMNSTACFLFRSKRIRKARMGGGGGRQSGWLRYRKKRGRCNKKGGDETKPLPQEKKNTGI